MRANSGAVAMCADNMARGVAQDRAQRCFAYMLHPGLFAGGGGLGRSALPAGPPLQKASPRPNPAHEARIEEGRQRMWANIARQLERHREDVARRPSGRTQHALDRSEAAFENNRCAG